VLNNKSEKLIIIGKSGSGKDHLLRHLKKEGLETSIKVTSRPKRVNEIDGVFEIDGVAETDGVNDGDGVSETDGVIDGDGDGWIV
jgi:stage III sporulation protein SpoIIIAA